VGHYNFELENLLFEGPRDLLQQDLAAAERYDHTDMTVWWFPVARSGLYHFAQELS